jgi:hypothetical protein
LSSEKVLPENSPVSETAVWLPGARAWENVTPSRMSLRSVGKCSAFAGDSTVSARTASIVSSTTTGGAFAIETSEGDRGGESARAESQTGATSGVGAASKEGSVQTKLAKTQAPTPPGERNRSRRTEFGAGTAARTSSSAAVTRSPTTTRRDAFSTREASAREAEAPERVAADHTTAVWISM